MLVSVFLALFIPCVGMTAVFFVYICLLWYAAGEHNTADLESGVAVKSIPGKGLSSSDLNKLPIVTGKELVLGDDCAVCLDDIKTQEPVRLLPGCNHGFHLECADTWLSRNSICPVCRAKIPPELFNPPPPLSQKEQC